MADRLRPSGNRELDTLIGGGLEPRVITQFYGGPGSGKSTLTVCAAVACIAAGEGVAYIDTEGFSVARFRQVAGEKTEEYAKNLFLFEPGTFDEQALVIGQAGDLLKQGGIGLVILDSATGLYRTRFEEGRDAIQGLAHQMLQLLGYAKRYDIPALITNQVYINTRTGVFTGLGGTALSHICKVIVRVDRLNGTRRAVLVKHRSRPADEWFDFVITGDGTRSITTVRAGIENIPSA